VGTSQTPAPQLRDWRQALLAVTPGGAIKLAHQSVGQAKVTDLGNRTYELTFPNNTKIRLDRDRHPAVVEMVVNHPVLRQATLTAEYSGYRDYEPIDPLQSDEAFSGFNFPSHIVHKLNGRTILDVQIKTCWCTNPYVIFPIPGRLNSRKRSNVMKPVRKSTTTSCGWRVSGHDPRGPGVSTHAHHSLA
jgi:hypothetical protein